MFAEKAFELIKELERNPDNLPAFNVSIAVSFQSKSLEIMCNSNISRMRWCAKSWTKSMPFSIKTATMREYFLKLFPHCLWLSDQYRMCVFHRMTCQQTGDRSLIPLIGFRHASLQRNKRCLLAYLYNRLDRIKEMRWQFGAIIPADIKQSLCEPEIQWFYAYSKNLAAYMRSIGDGLGVNLTGDLKPPKSLYVEVRCLADYGKFELDGGEVILLNKNSQHYLPRAECEPLIRQGILQHIA